MFGDLKRLGRETLVYGSSTVVGRLLNFLLSNCTWEDGNVVATFRQPFDLLAETAVTAARANIGHSAKSTKSEIWLGN